MEEKEEEDIARNRITLEDLQAEARSHGALDERNNLRHIACTCMSPVKVFSGHVSSCPIYRYNTTGTIGKIAVLREVVCQEGKKHHVGN